MSVRTQLRLLPLGRHFLLAHQFLLRHKANPREYLHWLFTKLPTVSAPNAGHFTPAAYSALRTQGAPVAAVA